MKSPPNVFVSYSYKDIAFADELLVHLKPLRQKFAFNIWSDQSIDPGDSWKSEIDEALQTADLAILLLSADYLASEWISNIELPTLLKRAEKGEIRILPVLLRPCAWTHTPLAYFKAFPQDAKPLVTLSELARDRAWLDLYDILEAELHRLSEGAEASHLKSPHHFESPRVEAGQKHKKTTKKVETVLPTDDGSRFFISHAKEDGDFAENLKFRLSEEGLLGLIDIDILEAGTDWRKELDEAILRSRALILVLSPDSKASEYVTYEWAFALGSGLRIVPLLLRDTSIHPRLEAFQYLDFTNRRARPWKRLLSMLKEFCASEEDA